MGKEEGVMGQIKQERGGEMLGFNEGIAKFWVYATGGRSANVAQLNS